MFFFFFSKQEVVKPQTLFWSLEPQRKSCLRLESVKLCILHYVPFSATSTIKLINQLDKLMISKEQTFPKLINYRDIFGKFIELLIKCKCEVH